MPLAADGEAMLYSKLYRFETTALWQLIPPFPTTRELSFAHKLRLLS